MTMRARGLALALLAAAPLGAQALVARLDGDRVRVSAPNLHFLAGRPLERLRSGSPVAYDVQLSLTADGGQALRRRAVERFGLSYDLWEEKFSVTSLGSSGRSASHLASAAAEAWCVESLALSAAGLAADQHFWLRLEVRAEDPRDRPPLVGEGGLSLARLIELFSRAPESQQPRWIEESGPLSLAKLKR